METNFLEIINTTIIKLLASQSIEQQCVTIIDEAKKLVKARNGGIFLLDKNKFENIYSTAPALMKIKARKKEYLEKLLKTNTIAILKNPEIYTLLPELEKTHVETIIIVPLINQTVAFGFLLLYCSRNEIFTQEQLQILQMYGSIATLAFIKTKLHEETKLALELRDRFISVASHELRTPLTSINGYIQLLYNKLANKDTAESRWVEELYHESSRLTNLVKDLLDINRIKQGQLAFVLNEINMKDVIEEAVSQIQIRNGDYDINFDHRSREDTYTVIGDKEKLREMVLALLGNAIKFSKPRTKIAITLSRSGTSVRIKIKDQGRGIPQEDINNIFNGFYKTDHTKDMEGMGVGLLLARHIVTFHRGKMSITSKINVGTVVEVILPSARI